MGRMNLADARTRKSTVDREKLDATTDQDIRRYQAEDGHADVEPPAVAREVRSPREIRVGLGMTQREIAAALHIPLGTWRNWEQGRVSLDPAARSLLEIVSEHPALALQALGTTPLIWNKAGAVKDFYTTHSYGAVHCTHQSDIIGVLDRTDLPGSLSAIGLKLDSSGQYLIPAASNPEEIAKLMRLFQSRTASQEKPYRLAGGGVGVPIKPTTRQKRRPVPDS